MLRYPANLCVLASVYCEAGIRPAEDNGERVTDRTGKARRRSPALVAYLVQRVFSNLPAYRRPVQIQYVCPEPGAYSTSMRTVPLTTVWTFTSLRATASSRFSISDALAIGFSRQLRAFRPPGAGGFPVPHAILCMLSMLNNGCFIPSCDPGCDFCETGRTYVHPRSIGDDDRHNGNISSADR